MRFSMSSQAVFRFLVGFARKRLPLDLELKNFALEHVDLLRKGIDLDTQLRSSLVDQIDRLVRQKAVGDVTVRKVAAATIAESLIRTP